MLETEESEVPPLDDQLIALVLSGTKVIESRQGARWRRGTYLPGCLALTAPGRSVHVRWRTPSKERQRALHVHLPGRLLADAAEQLWDVDARAVSMPDALVAADPVVEQVVRALGEAARRREDDLYAESAAAFLAVHLLGRYARPGDPPSPGREDARIRRAEEFMRDNLHVPVSLDDIARSVHLSKFHFARVFAAATGESPRRRLTRLRIDRARQHLAVSGRAIGEIGRLCGFAHANHFAQAFRRETGVSPATYRRQHGAAHPPEPGPPELG